MISKYLKITKKANTNLALLVLRAGASLMMLTHGIPKLMQFFSSEPIAFTSVMGLSMTFSLVLAVFSEVFCAIFVMMGLGTRLAAVPLIATMLTAAFHFHGSDPFASKELSLLYALMFIVLLLTGGGKYSIDYILSGKLKQKSAAMNV